MAEATSRENHPGAQQGIIAKSFGLLTKVIWLLLFSAIVSVIIEWVGMAYFYSERGYEGYEHAQIMLEKEIAYLSGTLQEDTLNEPLVIGTLTTVNYIIEKVFIGSGIIPKLNEIVTIQPGDWGFLKGLKRFVASIYDYIIAALYITAMFFVRLAILLLSMPVFLLFALVGLADGLMQRDLRRWCGGNESGFIYHYAKRFALPTLVTAWFVYLSIPNSVHPNYVLTPFAIAFGFVIMLMSSKFKKYL